MSEVELPYPSTHLKGQHAMRPVDELPDTTPSHDGNQPPVTRTDAPPGMDPVKWSAMNRAERRAYTRGRKR